MKWRHLLRLEQTQSGEAGYSNQSTSNFNFQSLTAKQLKLKAGWYIFFLHSEKNDSTGTYFIE